MQFFQDTVFTVSKIPGKEKVNSLHCYFQFLIRAVCYIDTSRPTWWEQNLHFFLFFSQELLSFISLSHLNRFYFGDDSHIAMIQKELRWKISLKALFFLFFFNLRLVSELFLTYHIFINRLKLITVTICTFQGIDHNEFLHLEKA